MSTEKRWEGLANQRVFGDKGKEWLMTELVEETKGLKPFSIPLKHLCTKDRLIAGVSISEFVAHMRMILDADMRHPIILDEEGAIFDGRHRVARALLDRMEKIKAVRFDEDPRPTIRGEG